jgi:hypothetical protein
MLLYFPVQLISYQEKQKPCNYSRIETIINDTTSMVINGYNLILEKK